MISKLNQPKSYKKPKQLFIKMPKLIHKMVKLVFKMLRLVFKLPKLLCPASHLQGLGWIPPKKSLTNCEKYLLARQALPPLLLRVAPSLLGNWRQSGAPGKLPEEGPVGQRPFRAGLAHPAVDARSAWLGGRFWC